LLGFKERTGVEGIAAQVVARNPNNWFSTVTLNRGANHGVRRDMVVVTAQGLVGRVSEVAPQTAKVMLITDPESGVGGLIQRSRDTGVVLGQTGDRARVIMKLFSPESAPLVGDKVITSGLGMVFPKGLSIGEVVSVETGDYGLVRYVEIEPAVDLDRLEEVLIIAVNVDGADPGPWGSSSHTAGDAS
jgi:rod shape-determining protein MreC